MAKRKSKKPPKPRHTWEINPKTRVKKSAKQYKRSRDKKKKQSWLDDIGWFE